ncbi:hypothetical protein ELH67_08540 [Rhizobium ruizarguesonis]|uniref:restriction endonuclease n=1 Tax=Rhizobium ruizarguesonis TaxID=2081791 RepID=UPI0010323E5C|nr:restriction endonuclease [Rhizobium ruizarguesonis]TAZ94595.1 hypothetical protein ELH67_08540 [Rhizobium ruizarguesonis]
MNITGLTGVGDATEKSDHYVDLIRRAIQTPEDAASFWRQIRSGKIEGWEDGKALEYLILRAFQLEQADIVWPFTVYFAGGQLEQIDGIVHFDHYTLMVECKDTVEKVNVEPVAKLRHQLSRRPPGILGSVFSTSGFSDAAVLLTTWTSQNNILLWNGADIKNALLKGRMIDSFRDKYAYLLRTGVPDLTIRNGREPE